MHLASAGDPVSNKPCIRVEADSVMATDVRVIYTNRKTGKETDISEACRAVKLEMRVGEPIIAHVEMVKVGVGLKASLVDVAVEEFKPRRRWLRRLRYWPLFRRDVSSIGTSHREYA